MAFTDEYVVTFSLKLVVLCIHLTLNLVMNQMLVLSKIKKRKSLLLVALFGSLLMIHPSVSFSQFSNVTISAGATANGTFTGGVFTPTANNAVLNLTTLQNAIISGADNVVINTTCGACSQAGNVSVAAITALRTATLSQLSFTINSGTGGTITTAAINVAGSASNGSAGTGRHGTTVILNAGSTLTVGGAITTSGSRRGSAVGGNAGDVTLVSGANVVIATGAITASGFAGSGGNFDGGDGGSISIQAGTGIRLTQNITASGGLLAGTGIGGDAGNVIIQNVSTTVTTGGGVNDGQTAGVITLAAAAGGGAIGTLTKQGAGTFVLNGANVYTGSTTINGGILRIDADASLGTAPGSPTAGHITLNGGTLSNSATFTLNTNRSIALGASGGGIEVASGTTLTFAGTIAGGNNLTKTLAGILTLGAGNVTVNDLAISAGTLNASTGTTFIAGNFTNAGTFNHSSGTVNFNGGGSQNIAGVIYNNLQTSTGGTKTLSGTTTVNSVLTIGASSILDLGSQTLNLAGSVTPLVVTGTLTPSTSTVNYTNVASTNVTAANYNNINLTGGARVLAATGTIGIAGSFTPGAGGFTVTGSTISFNGSGAQDIPAFTYNNLSTATGGTKTLTGTVTVNSVLTIGASSTLDLSSQTLNLAGSITPLVITGTFTSSGSTVNYTNAASTNVTATNYNNLNLTGGVRVLAASGTIGIAGTFTPGAGAITVTGSTIDFNGSGAQSIPTLSAGYNNLTASNSGTKTAGNLTINTQLTVAAGVTLAMGTNTISGASLTTSGTGLITTQAAAAAIPTGRTWSMEVAYNAAGAQQVIAGTYATLTASVSGTKTAAGNITATNLSVASGVTLAMGTNTISGASLATSGTGLITTQVAASAIPTGRTWSMEVQYNAAGAQQVIAGTYATLTASVSGTKTAAGNITATNLSVISGVTLDMGTNQLLGLSSGTGNAGIVRTSRSTAAVPTGLTWSGTVEYYGNGQEVIGGTYSSFVYSGGGFPYLENNLTVQSALTLSSGTIETSGYTFTIATSNITVSSGGLDASIGGVVFNVNATINLVDANPLFGGNPIDNLTLNGGVILNLASDQDIQGVLTITSGKLGLAANKVLSIYGTASMSATNCLKGDSLANLTILNPSVGTLYFDQVTGPHTNFVKDLTIGRIGNPTDIAASFSLGNIMKVKGNLSPLKGSVNSAGFLTIASDSLGSGRILAITPANFTFNGNVVVERYAKDKNSRRYIFIASPVAGLTVRQAWQDDIFITGPGTGGDPCNTGTGNGGATDKYNNKGFDATTGNQLTMFSYNQYLPARWVDILSTDTIIQRGRGYRVLFRGPRGVNDANCSTYLQTNTPPAPLEATLNVSGPVVAGDFSVSVSGATSVTPGASGFTLVGNPYACEIGFDVFRADNLVINPSYWTFDPNGPDGNVTSYLTYNNNSYAGGSHSGAVNSSNAHLIASGQAFFVQKAGIGDASVTFKESHKTAQAQRGVFRTTTLTWPARIRVNYAKSDGAFIDNILIRFSSDPTVAITETKEWDAITQNAGNFIAGLKGTRSFAIQTRPINFVNDTVGLRIVSAATGEFKLNFTEFNDFSEAAQIILLDMFQGTQTDVRANPSYVFNITSNTASQGGNRFKLVFRSLGSVMPLSFLNINAINKEQGVEVAWKVAFELGVIKYLVERSENGRDFIVVGEVASKGNSNTPVDYKYFDTRPVKGIVYYRVKSVEASESRCSAVVKLNGSVNQSPLVIYPNPVKDKLTIRYASNSLQLTGAVVIRNTEGKAVMQTVVSNGSKSIDVSSLASGIYFLSLTTNTGQVLMDKFVKQ
jgi:hypothetical protein